MCTVVVTLNRPRNRTNKHKRLSIDFLFYFIRPITRIKFLRLFTVGFSIKVTDRPMLCLTDSHLRTSVVVGRETET